MKTTHNYAQDLEQIMNLFDKRNYKEAKDLYEKCLTKALKSI